MKKIISLVLVLVLALSAIGGTLAYFTDTENATNTFTIGSVDIQLLESQIYTNVDTDKDADDIRADAKTYDDYLKEEGANIVPGQEVLKAVYVDNTGKNDAYVRIRIRMEQAEFHDAIFVMFNSTYSGEDKYMSRERTYFDSEGKVVEITDEVTQKDQWAYAEYAFVIQEPVKAGELTEYSPIWKFWLNPAYDNEDVTALGENALDKIVVYADAIQAEGFDTAEAAFAAFDGQTGAGTDHPGVEDKTDTQFGVETATE